MIYLNGWLRQVSLGSGGWGGVVLEQGWLRQVSLGYCRSYLPLLQLLYCSY